MPSIDSAAKADSGATTGQRHLVVFLPGIIMPAEYRYAPMIQVLGDRVQAVSKELEVYAGDAPPEGYSIETEVEGISRAANDAGFERFHLYGHSAGGACALAYASIHPERLLSLSLDEPASDFSEELKTELRQEMGRIRQLPAEEQMGAFVSLQLRPGVAPPPRPDGPPPDWMAKRPAGIEAIIRAMDQFTLPTDSLERFERPVYYSYGSLTNPWWEVMCQRLAERFPDFTGERYEGLHHFNTSHAAEPERVAATLERLWQRAEQASGEGVTA